MSAITPRPRKAVRFITRDDHKLYIHPQTGEFIPGVTSTIDNLPKPFLKAWGQKLVAEEAVAKYEAVGRLIEADPEAAVEYLKKAPNRVTAKSARQGKIAHGFFEELALGNTVHTEQEDIEVQLMVDHFKHYLDTMQPEPLLLEEGIWDERNDYAGTFDAIMRYNNPNLLIPVRDAFGQFVPGEYTPLVGVAWQDNKTTRSGVHPEVGLQLAAYRHAEYMLRADGSVMRNKPGDFGLVLHVRPEGWELIPVEAGQAELDTFLHLRAITDYLRDGNRKIVGQRLTGNRERRAKVTKGQLELSAPSTDLGELKVVG